MSKQLSLASAINYILYFKDYNEKFWHYTILYQLAILTKNHKAAAKYYKTVMALVPGEPTPAVSAAELESFLKKIVFPTQFPDQWDEFPGQVQYIIDYAVNLGNISAINAKAVALANHCPCTGFACGQADPTSQEEIDQLNRFIRFANEHVSSLYKEVGWLLKYSTAKSRIKASEMNFSAENLLTAKQKNVYATDREWTEYCDMVRMERSYARRVNALENIHQSALHKYIAGQLLYQQQSIIKFFSDNGTSEGYSIVQVANMDKETAKTLFDIAAAEGCHNASWQRD